MKSLVIHVFLLLIAMPLLSQIELSMDKVDYGLIDFKTDRVKDLVIKNTSSQDAILLKSNFPAEYDILFSSRQLSANSEVTLRVKFNPRRKGKFNDEVELWFTSQNEPVKIKFKGEVDYIDKRDNPSCPDFNSRPVACCDENTFIVEVLDKETQKPIYKSDVRLVLNGELKDHLKTNKDGIASKELPINYYFILVEAENYIPADSALYINRFENYIVFELEKFEKDEIDFVEDVETKEKEDSDINIEIEEEIVMEEMETTIPKSDQSEIFPESRYSRNNIVFLIDISSSMSTHGKMDILKASMLELVDALREVDQITVITYATKPELIVKTHAVQDKDQIKQSIQELTPRGSTSGAKGFQMAYSLAKKNFIPGGNNQIIVATDGAFKAADIPKISKMVKKNRFKITTSVVGIRSSKYTSKKLEEYANLGNGSFLYLDDYDQSKEALIQEIKLRSKR